MPTKLPEKNLNTLINTQLEQILKTQEVQTLINQALAQEINNAKREIKNYTDNAIEEIKQYIPLNDGEATELKQAVSKRALLTTKIWIKKKFNQEDYGGQDFFSKKYGHIIRSFYSMLKKQFGKIKYTAILHVDFKDALEFANSLNYWSLPKQTQRITESQLETLNEWEKRHGFELTIGD